jgi:acetamidase/formamidase
VLSIEILETKVGSWGWTAILPGLGLLTKDFPDPYLKIWDLSNGKSAKLHPNIVLSLDPFCGTMGVAPAEKGPVFPLPPGILGGNMDIRHLHQGSTLLLPVQVEGALFSAGDGHALQGDGEVCGTAIEAPLQFSLRFNVHRDFSIPGPQFVCRGQLMPEIDAKGYYATTGIGPDLKENAQKAVRNMIEHLIANHGLTWEEAYILCSLVVDLKISEIVSPNSIVSAYLPLSIFTE